MFTGAGFFKGPAQRTARLNSERGGDSYLFSFEYAAENATPHSLFGGDANTVHHGNDQSFLFNTGREYTERDLEVVNLYCDLVASFVTNLNPESNGVTWRPHTLFDDYYLAVRHHPQELERFSDAFYVMERERQEAADGWGTTTEWDETTEPDTTPTGSESTPTQTETDLTPKETDSTPKETDSTPKETDSTPKETDSTPEEADSTPKETDSTPAETDSTPTNTESTPTPTTVPTTPTTDAGARFGAALPLLLCLASLLIAS